MQDHDWMLPRRLHGPLASKPDEQPQTEDVRVDTNSLRARELRKQKLLPQPKGEDPLAGIDRRASAIPAFSARMWTLGDTARWVAERTAHAVDGNSIDETRLFEILPEIQEALSAGEIAVFVHTQNEPVPREVPAETWSVYDLAVELKNGLIRIFPLNAGSSDYQQQLLNVRLRREDVLRRWPDPSKAQTPVQPTTVGAENQCRRWLVAKMTEAPTKPEPKAAVRETALKTFSSLSNKAFDRAWSRAIREANATNWAAPGPRRP